VEDGTSIAPIDGTTDDKGVFETTVTGLTGMAPAPSP